MALEVVNLIVFACTLNTHIVARNANNKTVIFLFIIGFVFKVHLFPGRAYVKNSAGTIDAVKRLKKLKCDNK
jgi:hypothetical protein